MTAVMAFLGWKSDTGMYVNTNTPADDKTPCTFYWYDWNSKDSTSATITVNNHAHFADGSQSETKSLNASHSVEFDIYDAVAETVDMTISGNSGYNPNTLNTTFIEVI